MAAIEEAPLLDLLPLAVLQVDPAACVLRANAAWAELTGRHDDATAGADWVQAFGGAQGVVAGLVLGALAEQRPLSFDALGTTVLGERMLHLAGRPDVDATGRLRSYVLCVTDVADDRARQDRLTHEATHDALTGLLNRRAFLAATVRATSAAARTGGSCALLYVDLDDFKAVNDEGGHDAGDAVLRAVAQRLGAAARSDAYVARLGGDEFAVLAPVDSVAAASSLGERLLSVLRQPVHVGGRDWRVGASIGIAVSDDDRVELLIDGADAALYRAKAAGKSRCEVDRLDSPAPGAAADPAVAHDHRAGAARTSPAHAVSFYDDDEDLVDRLADHVLDGLAAGEVCVVIATAAHREGVRVRGGQGLATARTRGRYLELDARETLALFMRGGLPDPDLFRSAVGNLVRRRVAGGDSVRAYGEMVALLWADGEPAAALRLEELWNDLLAETAFGLWCADPASVVEVGGGDGLAQVCARHGTVLAA